MPGRQSADLVEVAMTERGSFVKPGHTLFELIEHFVQFGYCPNVLLMQLAQYSFPLE